ncbi:hypothetical protein DYB35_014101, partial [Aphanomyces astaci]
SSVPLDLVKTFTDEFQAEPRYIIAQNGLTSTQWRNIVCNRRDIAWQTHVFSKKASGHGCLQPERNGTVRSRETLNLTRLSLAFILSISRCWLFGTATLLRRALHTKYNLDKDFEISQNFFYFWDKFEKVNFFFENILTTAHEPVDTRIVAHFLSDPTSDGGQWDMIVNIINKYGACPKNVYGESFQTVDSERLNYLLGAKLRDFAKQLRDLHAAGATPADLQAAKVPMLQVCHRILSIHLGTPPTTFDFEAHDKDEKHVRVPHLTPRTFVMSVVPIDVNDYVSIVNDPRNALDSILTSTCFIYLHYEYI